MSRKKVDDLLTGFLGTCSAIAAIAVIGIAFFLILKSWSLITGPGWGYLFQITWDPASSDGQPKYGLFSMLVGSLAVTLGAGLIAIPASFLLAIFCHFYISGFLNWISRQVLFLAAAIPSVVYGLWGIQVLVPWINYLHSPGTSLLAGILIVAMMIFPTVCIIVMKTFQEVDQDAIVAGVALGLSRWTLIRRVVLPMSARGGFTAAMMGIGRAVGETMAVVMVCGNIPQLPGSVFHSVRCLTANIALEMSYALEDHQEVLFFSGTILLLVSVLLVATVHLFTGRHVDASGIR